MEETELETQRRVAFDQFVTAISDRCAVSGDFKRDPSTGEVSYRVAFLPVEHIKATLSVGDEP